MAIVLQALLNMAVAVGLAPTTGVTLPFFSAGGSSLLVTLGALRGRWPERVPWRARGEAGPDVASRPSARSAARPAALRPRAGRGRGCSALLWLVARCGRGTAARGAHVQVTGDAPLPEAEVIATAVHRSRRSARYPGPPRPCARRRRGAAAGARAAVEVRFPGTVRPRDRAARGGRPWWSRAGRPQPCPCLVDADGTHLRRGAGAEEADLPVLLGPGARHARASGRPGQEAGRCSRTSAGSSPPGIARALPRV
ncbi:MAG: FtsW/RodA/SpoVE family cell cycle protein [Ignavibacteriales bacterium]|nr:FtsW/RodA/SpoVE family cell cycle protein [Ignavibacteriales bacterium]